MPLCSLEHSFRVLHFQLALLTSPNDVGAHLIDFFTTAFDFRLQPGNGHFTITVRSHEVVQLALLSLCDDLRGDNLLGVNRFALIVELVDSILLALTTLVLLTAQLSLIFDSLLESVLRSLTSFVFILAQFAFRSIDSIPILLIGQLLALTSDTLVHLFSRDNFSRLRASVNAVHDRRGESTGRFTDGRCDLTQLDWFQLKQVNEEVYDEGNDGTNDTRVFHVDDVSVKCPRTRKSAGFNQVRHTRKKREQVWRCRHTDRDHCPRVHASEKPVRPLLITRLHRLTR